MWNEIMIFYCKFKLNESYLKFIKIICMHHINKYCIYQLTAPKFKLVFVHETEIDFNIVGFVICLKNVKYIMF